MGLSEWFNSWGLGPELSEEQKERIFDAAREVADEGVQILPLNFGERGRYRPNATRLEIGRQPFFGGPHHCGMPMVKVLLYRGDGRCKEHEAANEVRISPPVWVCPCCFRAYLDFRFHTVQGD